MLHERTKLRKGTYPPLLSATYCRKLNESDSLSRTVSLTSFEEGSL